MKTKGFTIIELVVVVVLLGILGFALIPKFFGLNPYQQRTYYDAVLNSIRYAQKVAIATDCHIEVSIPTGTSLELKQRDGCQSGNFNTKVPVFDPQNNAQGFTRNSPSSDITVTSTDLPIYFNGLGECIRESNNQKGNYTVIVGGANN